MYMIDVSVCIVNWNTRELLRECIKSIKEKTSGIIYEIIIVDNASVDGSAEMLKEEFPDCKLIASRENLGFAKGNNRAVAEAGGNYILYLNPDTKLATNAICGLHSFLEKNPKYGTVGCRLVNADDSIQFTCARTFPTLFNQFCDLMLLNRVFPKFKLFSSIEMAYWDHNDSRDIDCLSGACIFARRQIIEKLKGFDENFFMYAEDVDLCYRIKNDGWKLYYLSTEKIYHIEGASSKKSSQKYFSAIAQRESNYYYFLKHFGVIQAKAYKTIIFFGSLFRLFVIRLLNLGNHGTAAQNREFVFLKYVNLLLWSLGRKKIHESSNKAST